MQKRTQTRNEGETNAVLSALPDVPEMNRPLSIRVTDAGGMVVKWHNLLRRCLPVLENPDSFPSAYREEIVKEMKAALETLSEEDEAVWNEETKEVYEPGSWFDEALDREEREIERRALWN